MRIGALYGISESIAEIDFYCSLAEYARDSNGSTETIRMSGDLLLRRFSTAGV